MGTSSPPQKEHSSPILAHVCCGQTAGWIKMPLRPRVRLGPGNIVLDGNPAPPPEGAQQPRSFRPVSIVAKQSPISATAEHLLNSEAPVLFFKNPLLFLSDRL